MASSDRSRANQERFNQVATSYFSAPFSFFEVLGERLVDGLEIANGQRVLDIGCGTGASTLPAGRRVGATGRVVGVDISTAMLGIAGRRSRDEGHHWVNYVQSDIAALRLDERFDVGVCGFAMQMFDDITTVPRALVRHMKDDGKVGLSVWAEGSWEPHSSVFRRIVSDMRPDLLPKPGNIEKLQEPGVIESAMATSGFAKVLIQTVRMPHTLSNFGEYWHLVTTLGGRGVVDKLNPAEVTNLRSMLESAIALECDSNGHLTLSMDSMFVYGTRI